MLKRTIANNRVTRRRFKSLRRRMVNVFLGAALGAGAYAPSDTAHAMTWTPGIGPVTFTGLDLVSGVDIDIDNDGVNDFSLSGDIEYGPVLLTPNIVNSVNNEVFSTFSGFSDDVTAFFDEDEVFQAFLDGDPTTVAPNSATVGFDFFPFGEAPPPFAGLLFERPGGSLYVGYLEMWGDSFSEFTIESSGFQPTPEPGTAVLLGMGVLGLCLRSRNSGEKR